MSFKSDNRAFEKWLRKQCAVVDADLKHKHEKMRRDAFTFLRATYFRWARRIEAVCPELCAAPSVLSVGDLHLENFGTWRDVEGRLVWGVNDFDEAAVMPYPFDLVRLTASARLAPGMQISDRKIAGAVLRGYRRGLDAPRPTLLDEQESWMRPYVACSDEDRQVFWREIDDLSEAEPPGEVTRGLQHCLPKGAEILRFAVRRKGGGGLGRPRFVAVAAWRGGRIAREAKALVASAWSWAHDSRKRRLRFMDLATARYRSPDPWLMTHRHFIFRRIAADTRKVELDRDAQVRLTIKLLEAMGFDLGAIHAAGRRKRGKAIRADLAKRPAAWLHDAAGRAVADVKRDYEEWPSRRRGPEGGWWRTALSSATNSAARDLRRGQR